MKINIKLISTALSFLILGYGLGCLASSYTFVREGVVIPAFFLVSIEEQKMNKNDVQVAKWEKLQMESSIRAATLYARPKLILEYGWKYATLDYHILPLPLSTLDRYVNNHPELNVNKEDKLYLASFRKVKPDVALNSSESGTTK